ncbi:MAG: dUTP diphosphatase [Candidatus Phytoplasma asteris]|uniref:dUTP diphosphatase n=2 Tax=16SrI (Aster yellows group) TaxID=3042590 RepID=Q6YR52_ONYPE|nr:dUTP diphosphatase ['Chrysanthemum coronarium' phytoplasma]TKA87630.1 MAG: deoxyuridine 5'-triphosphate nucleotidohydrolase [Periwinkle leaf yellowing phytoplasma]WEX19989.1 MAG: dUTP diphosphatase [Candidatus Phytoplasma asteris]BAD04249.1 dUTPase [Onion yellows phytoplasma OY-M]GAK73792.1 dUTPase ['Chrysanthemum coronarium' phytoplasma]
MNKTNRFFEKVSSYQNQGINLPQRQTKFSAGYDFEAAQSMEIPPQTFILVPTGIKASFPWNEVLLIYVRSSLPLKKQLTLANGVGVVDSDYYNNLQNEGHIFIALYNFSKNPVQVCKGERIAQGIFQPFFQITQEKENNFARKGGFGSTK